MAFTIFFAFSLLIHGVLGELMCEQLPVDLCSYSISTSGKRCLLEKSYATKDESVKLQCKTLDVTVDIMHEWIETDECVSACGVDRKDIGILSDSLLNSQFLTKLCSDDCYEGCPNIVDLYYNLALGEGLFLPDLCGNPRRAVYQDKNSGPAATLLVYKPRAAPALTAARLIAGKPVAAPAIYVDTVPTANLPYGALIPIGSFDPTFDWTADKKPAYSPSDG